MARFATPLLPRCRRLAGNLFRAAAYLSVMVSLWQAPLPWIHGHSSQDAQQPTLLKHVTAYHSGGEQRRTWHLHFALLADIVRGGGCPVPPEEDSSDRDSPQALVLTPESTAGSQRLSQPESWLTGILSAAFSLQAAPSRAVEADSPFLDRHPLNRFASSGDLLPLLCLCRC